MIGFITIVLLDPNEQIVLFLEMIGIWGLFFILLKYEERQENDKRNLTLIFEELEKDKDDEYIEYIKDKDFLKTIENSLIRYNNLNSLVDKFTGVLDLKEIEKIFLDVVSMLLMLTM
jgi:hypothetical protein